MADKQEKDLEETVDCEFIRGLKDDIGIRISKLNLLNGVLISRGVIMKEEANKKLMQGTYYHNESISDEGLIYGILLVLTAEDLQCQIDITLDGRISFRLSHGWDIDNPVWVIGWTSIR